MTIKTYVVIALVKLENLKAIHNENAAAMAAQQVVIALVKLENLKANRNDMKKPGCYGPAPEGP